MNNPFSRRRPEADTAAQLRRRLAEQARHTPDASGLAEQIIARAEAERAGYVRPTQDPPEPSRGRPWGRIVAVAAVVAAIAGISVAVTQYDFTPNHDDAARTVTPTPSTPSTPSAPSTTEPPATSSSEPAPTQHTDSSGVRTIRPSGLQSVQVADVTFTANGGGFGLASAKCVKGPGRCTALLHTSDGGKSWTGRPHTPFQVAGVTDSSAPMVEHIRFANADVGYIFGRSALFATTDGGTSWEPQSGGADALETLDGNVIRVSSDAKSCPPGCKYTVQTAPVGSTDWTDVSLPGAGYRPDDSVTLSRTGSAAYLLTTGNPAGGASDARGTLWSSGDNGASWTNRGEPCPQRGGEVDATHLTTAADGSVAVTCQQRSGGATSIAVSRDSGASFRAGPAVLGSADVQALGAASASVILVSTDDTYISGNSGRTFRRLAANAGSSPGQVKYLGFASDTDAHAISSDGTRISTTADAGRTWTTTATFG